jgi:hypothetical protein
MFKNHLLQAWLPGPFPDILIFHEAKVALFRLDFSDKADYIFQQKQSGEP